MRNVLALRERKPLFFLSLYSLFLLFKLTVAYVHAELCEAVAYSLLEQINKKEHANVVHYDDV